MHVLVAFVLITSLVAGFQTVHERPDGHQYLVVDADQDVRVSTWMETAKDLESRQIVMQEFDYSCGSAALATLLNYHLGEQFTEMQVIEGLMAYGNIERIQERRAFSLLDMKRFVDAIGYEGQGYRAEMENLKELEVPVVLPIELFGYQHFVVFRGIHDGRVFLADPWIGHTTYTIHAFEDMWYEQVLFMVDPGGRPTLSRLSLTEADRRYIDSDQVRWTLFPHDPWHMQFVPEREFMKMDDDVMPIR